MLWVPLASPESLAAYISEEGQLSRILAAFWEQTPVPLPRLPHSTDCRRLVRIRVIEADFAHLAFEKDLMGSL